MLRPLALAIPLAVFVACAEPTGLARQSNAVPKLNAVLSESPLLAHSEAPPSPGECSFSQGVTTCISTSQYQETGTHTVYGGCVAGPTGVPGRSVTVYEDTYLVTAVTTTEYHGASDRIIQSNTVTTRDLVSSVQISRTCEPL
jgi:hypothetical protein